MTDAPDAAMITAAAGALDDVIPANDAAIAKIDSAIALFSGTDASKLSRLSAIRGQLAAFSPTFAFLQQELASLVAEVTPPADQPATDAT